MAEPSEFVKRLTEALKPGIRAVAQDVPATKAVAEGADVPDLYTFAGFLSDPVEQPGVAGKMWQLLYLDMALNNWLLVEDDGVKHDGVVKEDKAPDGELNVLWVTANTAVGIGRGSQSLEAQFLTGEFTRAADFRASPRGGTLAAATGVFCDAQSIGCCRPTNR